MVPSPSPPPILPRTQKTTWGNREGEGEDRYWKTFLVDGIIDLKRRWRRRDICLYELSTPNFLFSPRTNISGIMKTRTETGKKGGEARCYEICPHLAFLRFNALLRRIPRKVNYTSQSPARDPCNDHAAPTHVDKAWVSWEEGRKEERAYLRKSIRQRGDRWGSKRLTAGSCRDQRLGGGGGQKLQK